MTNNKKAFTLIELLVVIAIIGILATISVLALANARSKSRDAKRAGDAKQIQTALELFFNDNNRYPTVEEWNTGKIYSTSTGVTSTYMQIIPNAPTPADGLCTDAKNTIGYTPSSDGSTYSISFCLGNNTGSLAPGPKCLTPGGIIDDDCFKAIKFAVAIGDSGYQYGSNLFKTADGGYIITGDNNADFYIAKVTSDGSLDSGFGVGGIKTVGGAGVQYANSIIQTTDGGYLAVGYTSPTGGPGGDMYIAKLTASGSLDTGFGTGGVVTNGGTGTQVAYSVVQTTDGGYIIAGHTPTNVVDMYLVKLTASGSLDASFGTGGAKTVGTVSGEEIAYSVIQSTDGGYVVTGSTSFDSGNIYVAKLTVNGSLDASFGTGGIQNFGDSGYQYARSIIQTSDGGYAIVGPDDSVSDLYVAKLTVSGSLDTGFGPNGIRFVSESGYQQGFCVSQTSDGGYIVGGYSDTPQGNMYIVKLTSGGLLDPTFDSDGIKNINANRTNSIFQTSDGGYIAGGSIGTNGGDLYLVKMDSAGSFE
ncbi:MAG: prepilin-type N-terminal cleavage/methylation domain-containing protein [Candidatus Falkowbacteria bacterium]